MPLEFVSIDNHFIQDEHFFAMMSVGIVVLLLLCVLLQVSAVRTSGQNERTRSDRRQLGSDKKVKKNDMSNGRQALETWARSLTEMDYNVTNWKTKFRSKTPQVFFDQYLKAMSAVFGTEEAHVNFALVGACDGLADPTIRLRFLPNKHWRAVFVEPMTPNVRDLTAYLTKHDAIDRSLIIQAACTQICEEPTLQVERPLYEELNNNKTKEEKKDIPHWLRREIGSIKPKHRAHARPDWVLEEVRCVTATDILMDWAHSPKFRKDPEKKLRTVNSKGQAIIRKRRPHVLKIDVEGHDHEVLMSFVNKDTPLMELPLLIEFEAKSIGKHFPAAKEEMEKAGYVVSDFAADGFAMLKGAKILEMLGAE